jgi:hypothetical protein
MKLTRAVALALVAYLAGTNATSSTTPTPVGLSNISFGSIGTGIGGILSGNLVKPDGGLASNAGVLATVPGFLAATPALSAGSLQDVTAIVQNPTNLITAGSGAANLIPAATGNLIGGGLQNTAAFLNNPGQATTDTVSLLATTPGQVLSGSAGGASFISQALTPGSGLSDANNAAISGLPAQFTNLGASTNSSIVNAITNPSSIGTTLTGLGTTAQGAATSFGTASTAANTLINTGSSAVSTALPNFGANLAANPINLIATATAANMTGSNAIQAGLDAWRLVLNPAPPAP